MLKHALIAPINADVPKPPPVAEVPCGQDGGWPATARAKGD